MKVKVSSENGQVYIETALPGESEPLKLTVNRAGARAIANLIRSGGIEKRTMSDLDPFASLLDTAASANCLSFEMECP